MRWNVPAGGVPGVDRTPGRSLRQLLSLVVLLAVAGCESAPRIVELTVVPATVCPGDVVTVRVVAEDYEAARMTADPDPAASALPADFSRQERLWTTEATARICEPTTFTFTAWKGTEGACPSRESPLTVCRSAAASVVAGSEAVTLTFDPCAVPEAPGRVDFELGDRDYPASLVISEVLNCGDRAVVLARDDGGAAVEAAPRSPFAGLAGQPLVGGWSAWETVWTHESCDRPPESMIGEPPPIPEPRPPPICLAFAVSCPASDDCEG